MMTFFASFRNSVGALGETFLRVRRTASLLLSVSLLAGALGVSPAHAKTEPTVVVELFTSQGCSSCPPADVLLGEMVEHPNIIALTEAVDYWDYLGWKDENGRAAHSERQRDYARLRGDRRVYTPQMVINGRTHVVGSRRSAVTKELNRAVKQGAAPVGVSASLSGEVMSIKVDGKPSGFSGKASGNIVVVFYEKSLTVDIKRGENRGRTITYHNVVRDMHSVGMWSGKELSLQLPIAEMKKAGYDGCAVLLQADHRGLPGAIYGAAKVALH